MIDDNSAGRGMSDRWLRVFLAVVDAGSFTQAGRELGIGQPAVSHAIKQMETTLGSAVFRREAGTVSLTEAGRRLCEGVRAGFDTVDRSVRTYRLEGRDNEVELSVSTALATYWLMPRLGDFRLRHPDVELRVRTCDNDRLVGVDQADLWIPLGQGPWPNLEPTLFHDERIYPVAAPDHPLARRNQDDNDDLIDADLLIHTERSLARYDWDRWFTAHRQARPTRGHTLEFSDYSLVVRAALAGQGVALGWHHIVRGLVDEGLLARIGRFEALTTEPFVILAQPIATVRPAVQALRDWLIDAAADAAPS